MLYLLYMLFVLHVAKRAMCDLLYVAKRVMYDYLPCGDPLVGDAP